MTGSCYARLGGGSEYSLVALKGCLDLGTHGSNELNESCEPTEGGATLPEGGREGDADLEMGGAARLGCGEGERLTGDDSSW